MATPSTSASAPAAPPSSAFPLTAAARFPRATSSSTSSTRASALVERRRTRRRRLPEGSGGDRSAAAGAVEKGLRLAFLEQLADAIYDMVAAGPSPGPRSFHGLVAAQVLAGDAEGAATCGIPEIAFATFENMEYGGEDYMKPDNESYNWVIQAFTRATSYDRSPNSSRASNEPAPFPAGWPISAWRRQIEGVCRDLGQTRSIQKTRGSK